MIALNHALTGVAVGLSLQKLWLVAPVAFASHFALDILPHFGHKMYDYGSKHAAKFYIADAVLAAAALLAVALIMPRLMLPALLGAAFATLPDMFWLLHHQFGVKHWFFSFHQAIQWFEQPPGVLVEASYLIFIGTTIVALTR